MNEDSQYSVKGRVATKPRKTTLRQDLSDIGRSLIGRIGRQRKMKIDDAVDEAETGRKQR